MFSSPVHSVRSDFARVISRKFAHGRFFVVGADPNKFGRQFAETGREAFVSESCADLAEKSQRDSAAARFEIGVWFYSSEKSDDDHIAEQLSRCASDIVLIPGAGADFTKRRPQLVESFRRLGLLPDYGCDLGELDPAALCLRRRPPEIREALVPTVEAAFSRLHTQMGWLQRILRTRMAELEAADRHIARLEEKLLKLKRYRREIKLLKEQKQALRRSPERRIGQIVTAPYRLPQKLFREVRKQLRLRSGEREQSAAATEYQAWLQRHRASASDLDRVRREARELLFQPLVSIITPVFNTPVRRLEETVQSVRDQAYARWELLLVNDASTNPETLAALSAIPGSDPRIQLIHRKERGGISAASNTGIFRARGEWLALFDHDDILEPDALFHIVKVLSRASRRRSHLLR